MPSATSPTSLAIAKRWYMQFRGLGFNICGSGHFVPEFRMHERVGNLAKGSNRQPSNGIAITIAAIYDDFYYY